MSRTVAAPTRAPRPAPAPLPPAEAEIAALDHACKSSTVRSRRARAARKAGIKAHVTIPVPPLMVKALLDAEPPWLQNEDRHNPQAIAEAFARYWRALWQL